MAKNDVVLLDGILEQRVAEAYPSNQLDEAFEFFTFEQLLKDYDLSREELESGWVDGRDDGGIDGFFSLINGQLLQDPETFSWPKRNAAIEVIIITSKHHDTFQQAPLNSLVASLSELLDLSLDKDKLRGKYSGELLKARLFFHLAYRRLSPIRPTLSFRFAYASRGDTTLVAENIQARADQIIGTSRSLFSSCSVRFDFIGATELVALYRQTKKFSLDLPFLECFAGEQASYILLARLDEYCRFVTDEHNHLRRYLFDSNVRDYLGENRVNEDIIESLRDSSAPDFWWLNNGVTILATAATVLGKTIQLQDIQIVNGLQTTQSIFHHFQGGDQTSANRGVLVKVIVSTDLLVRDRIVRATNNQTVIELSSLHATDKIQRDIEDILERHGWFYERRKNYYRNIGKPAVRFVTPMYIAAGYVALVLKNPTAAARLKSRFMNNPISYAAVFSEDVPLAVWPTIVEVLKRTEEGLIQVRPTLSGAGERFLANWRNLVAFLIVGRILGCYSYSVGDFIAIDASSVTHALVQETWKSIESNPYSGKSRPFRSEALAYQCCLAAANVHGITGLQVVGRRKIPTHNYPTAELMDQVDALLPSQPWKPGIHKELAAKLKIDPSTIWATINELVARGRRYRQEDGVVYNKDGTVMVVDTSRTSEQKENL